MNRFDAVVVGAGPAGSTAAYRLAEAGRRVLVVDRARFPRDKPCGGGLTMRAVRLLPFSVDPVVEDVVDRIEVRLGYGKHFERVGRAPLCLMTQRLRLDHFLLEQAAAAGAEVREGVRVDGVEERDDAVGIVVDGEEIEASALLVADGANGTTARGLGLGGAVVHGVALEGNVAYSSAPRMRYAGRMVIEFGIVPGGYGWVFPKGDHVNVGVGGWGEEGPKLRAHLRRLCEEHRIDPASVESTRGHRLPMRRPEHRIARGRVALVGDSAGLVDPFSGDGMYEAFYSSRLAAVAVLDLLEGRAPSLDQYETAVWRAIGPLTAAGWGAKVALDRFPRLTFTLARLPPTWRAVEKLLQGRLGHPAAARGIERVAMKSISAVARRAGDPGRAYKAEAA